MALSPPFPVIEVELTYNGSKRTVLSLIDSGSTFSVFSRVLADKLGIDVLQGRVQRLSTLGGSVLAYGHELEIEATHDLRYRTEVLVIEIPYRAIYWGTAVSWITLCGAAQQIWFDLSSLGKLKFPHHSAL